MFVKMIREQHLPNCLVTVDDANGAVKVKIYGTDVATLQGKTTRRTPEHVPSNQLYPLPWPCQTFRFSKDGSVEVMALLENELFSCVNKVGHDCSEWCDVVR